jgi:hypothetical protein
MMDTLGRPHVSRRSAAVGLASLLWIAVGATCGPSPSTTEDEMRVTFNTDPGDPVYAKAVASDGTEYLLYGDKDEAGKILSLTQLDIKTGDGTVVQSALDEESRPSRLVSSDTSTATIAYDGSTAKVLVTDPAGNEVTDKIVVNPSTAKLGRALQRAAQAGDQALLCGVLDTTSELFKEIFDCTGRQNTAICSGSISTAAITTENFCKFVEQEVAADQLGTTLPTAVLPFGAGVVSFPQSQANGLSVELAAVGFGGKEPYSFSWSITGGLNDLTITNANLQFASVLITLPGIYDITVTVTDGESKTTSDTVRVVRF